MNNWVIVGDSARARFYKTKNATSDFQEFQTLIHNESRMQEQELTSDRSGNSHDTAGMSRFNINPDQNTKQKESEKFAHEIASYLEKSRTDNKFSQLVVVAAPKFLGQLRHELSDSCKRMIVSEYDKNISHIRTSDLRTHLPSKLW
ncbi:MAG: protein required for attachment to host cells [Colwellia sp.]|jgi:protein required for attachment to host cells